MRNIMIILTTFVFTMSSFSFINATTSSSGAPDVVPQKNPSPGSLTSTPNANSTPNLLRTEVDKSPRDLATVIERFQEEIPTSSRSKQPYNVLALIADVDHPVFRSALAGYPDIATVDYFDGRSLVPTVAQLLPYDVVITWPNYAYADMVATGDTLAAYVDAGGAVICAAWCWYLFMNHLEGEIMDPSYNPFTGLGPCHFDSTGLGWYEPAHPIMAGVTAVSDRIRDSLTINPGADPVAQWDDGEWFIATKGKVVGINGNPGDYGYFTGDMILIYYNAVIWTQIAAEYAIFQDQNPWGWESNQEVLTNNLLPFDVYSSSDIGVVDLSPYRKVIVASQQPDTFYVKVSANRAWFESYIANGGVLEFHGASYFVDDWAGLTMPTGFTCVPQDVNWTNSVSIQHAGHPVVLIPSIITDAELDNWSYSTHGYLIDLLPGYDEVLRHDYASEPCMAVQGYGDGWLIATMNTLEHGYGMGYSTILENVLLWIPGATYAIFQDGDPWGFKSNEDILTANGIHYDIYNSSHMRLADLSMYTKIVTSSMQSSSFYDSVSTHRTRFENYITNGGILEFHGAAGDWSGLTMPTGFTSNYTLSNSISIQAPGHHIVTTPNIIGDVELDNWNYSTHGDLVSLIPGYTEILRNDSTGLPTLAVLEYGSGWLIAAMNTLEWGYGWGHSPILENVLLYIPVVEVEETASISGAQRLVLHQNWPNPFEHKTSISYHIPTPAHISLKIYDRAGRWVKTLVDGMVAPGTMTAVWNGKNALGRKVANGIYFYSLETGDKTLTKKLVFLR